MDRCVDYGEVLKKGIDVVEHPRVGGLAAFLNLIKIGLR